MFQIFLVCVITFVTSWLFINLVFAIDKKQNIGNLYKKFDSIMTKISNKILIFTILSIVMLIIISLLKSRTNIDHGFIGNIISAYMTLSFSKFGIYLYEQKKFQITSIKYFVVDTFFDELNFINSFSRTSIVLFVLGVVFYFVFSLIGDDYNYIVVPFLSSAFIFAVIGLILSRTRTIDGYLKKYILTLGSYYRKNKDVISSIKVTNNDFSDVINVLKTNKNYKICSMFFSKHIKSINLKMANYNDNMFKMCRKKVFVNWFIIYTILPLGISTVLILFIHAYGLFKVDFSLIWIHILIDILISFLLLKINFKTIKGVVYQKKYINIQYIDNSFINMYSYSYAVINGRYELLLIYNEFRAIIEIYLQNCNDKDSFIRDVYEKCLLTEESTYIDLFFLFVIYTLSGNVVFSKKYIDQLSKISSKKEVPLYLLDFHKLYESLEQNFENYWIGK